MNFSLVTWAILGMGRIQKVILLTEEMKGKKKKKTCTYLHIAEMHNFMSPIHEFMSACSIDANKNSKIEISYF